MARPFEGLRVLDLGVIVMGGEAGRLFADQGADVIKVENGRYPDGARAAGMTRGFAAGHRNKRSIGIDLRHADGRALFERLVAASDVVLTNFKPGTLASLGLDYDRLRAANSRIVLVTSSAMGETGPWRDWMGYGPLVRCVSGLTSLWRDAYGFGDTTTVYPDHFAARVAASAALAALVARERTGEGTHIECSQAESILMALGAQFLAESLGADPSVAAQADTLVLPCAGDDEWCVISARDDADRVALAGVTGAPSDEVVAAWASTRTPREVAEVLQRAGVPAAPMVRAAELVDCPQLRSRNFFRQLEQPGIDTVVVTENGLCRSLHQPDPDVRPAPFYAQHTREVCREVLGMEDAAITALVERGVLDEA